jgi:hypothetical protein
MMFGEMLMAGHDDAIHLRVQDLELELERLRALARYATHFGGCQIRQLKACSCGYFKTLQEVRHRPPSLADS